MASAYPVAGAMASWSWKFARDGIGYERQWGWAVSGIVLAAHLGKVGRVSTALTQILLYLYNTATFVTQLYILGAHIPLDPSSGQAADPQGWWNPGFDVAAITIISLILISRTSRSPKFWITVGTLNLVLGLCVVALLIVAAVKAR